MSDAPARSAADAPGGVAFWTGLGVGAFIIAVGVRGMLQNLRPKGIVNLATFFGAAGIAHDLVWAPVLVVGALATRKLPVAARRTVRIALFLSAGLVLFAAPVLHGYAGRARNPSAVPLDYTRNVMALLIALWAAVAARLLLGVARRRRRPLSHQ